MDFLDQYGPALGGAFITILALVGVVRVLWRLALEAQTKLFDKVVEQLLLRIAEKDERNKEIHDELRIERAEKEGFERLVQRGDDMLEASLSEVRAWRERFERLQAERRKRAP